MKNYHGPLISLGVTIACIVVAEIFLQFFAPVPDPYYKYYQKDVNQYVDVLPPNYRVVTEAEEGLPGISGKNNFTTNNVGFRGDYLEMPKPENEFRIFLMGASNVECFYLDDSEAINVIMQKEFEKIATDGISVKVYNAGHSGYKSDDFISILVHRILHLEPDMLVIIGPNDLYPALNDYDYLHFTNESVKNKIPLFKFLATEFQIPRRIYYIFKKINPTDEEILETVTVKSGYKKMAERAQAAPVSDITPRVDLDPFETNLKTIIGIAEANNVKLLLTTIQNTWNSSEDPELKKWHWSLYSLSEKIRYKENLMYEALEKYNDVTRHLSAEFSIPLYEMTDKIPRTREYFYDDGHFNVKGAALAGTMISSSIREKGLLQH